jgi:hypothetical protein
LNTCGPVTACLSVTPNWASVDHSCLHLESGPRTPLPNRLIVILRIPPAMSSRQSGNFLRPAAPAPHLAHTVRPGMAATGHKGISRSTRRAKKRHRKMHQKANQAKSCFVTALRGLREVFVLFVPRTLDRPRAAEYLFNGQSGRARARAPIPSSSYPLISAPPPPARMSTGSRVCTTDGRSGREPERSVLSSLLCASVSLW